ncbi:MAG: hypothetical protein AB4038_00715 [Prochloraceae cyanobacterium]
MFLSAQVQESQTELTQITNRVTENLAQAINQAVGKLERLTETTNGAINNVNTVTNMALKTVTETADRATASLNATIEKAEHLSESLVDQLQTAIIISLQNWLEAHPILSWMITHPLYALGLLLLFLILFWGLLKIIGRFSEQFWLSVLQLPLKLFQWLLRVFFRAFKNHTDSAIVINQKSSGYNKQERLAYILKRLEEIRQEQEELLKEMQAIIDV